MSFTVPENTQGLYVNGVTHLMPKYTPEQRIIAFWSYVNKNGSIPEHRPELGPCWEWIGSLQKNGYGRFHIDPKNKPHAHRAIWIMVNGEIPKGLFVLHECDNPKCVRLDHLRLGTRQDNVDDMMAKGRRADTHGGKSPSHKLTSVQVDEIRNRYALGGTSQRKLAKEYGTCKSTIGYIVRREYWK